MVTTNKINWIKTLMKSLNIDIIMSWEYGLTVFLIGLILVAYGVKQGKDKDEDFTKVPIIRPTTKILFGSFIMIFGIIQLLPLLRYL